MAGFVYSIYFMRHCRDQRILEVGSSTCFRNIVSGAKQSLKLPSDTQPIEIELVCEVTESTKTQPLCDGMKTGASNFTESRGNQPLPVTEPYALGTNHLKEPEVDKLEEEVAFAWQSQQHHDPLE